jgi:trans-aconitate methyltransferase
MPDFSTEKERKRLEEVAEWFDNRHGINYDLAKYAAALIIKHAQGDRALELGCASGVMTRELVERFPCLDVVEAASNYAEQARAILQKGCVYECLFEEFQIKERYDTIAATWILEHVDNPSALLSRVRAWLNPKGCIYIAVPNAESLHRRVGLQMGLLNSLDQLNDSDIAIGHRRVYTWDTLTADITAAGLQVVSMEGILLKPLPSAAMEALSPDQRAAFFGLASIAPRLCSEIFAICRI